MGGGLVAGLSYSWSHHPAVCHPLLVPASLFAEGPREGHTRAEKKRNSSAKTQEPCRRKQFHWDGQRWGQMDGCMDDRWMNECMDGCMDICLQPLRVFIRSVSNQALSFFRFLSHSEDSAGPPSVSDLLVCDNHPAKLPHWHGHLQAQVHWAALQTVGLQSQLFDGYV